MSAALVGMRHPDSLPPNEGEGVASLPPGTHLLGKWAATFHLATSCVGSREVNRPTFGPQVKYICITATAVRYLNLVSPPPVS
jgi:hypothetical protein